jgi:histidinol-phosphate/aromatic aminotransferase/cobyric acid decarboxylase-like protein
MGVWSRYAAGDILRLGAAPGHPFPPLDNMLRATIGTDAEMVKLREVFRKVYKG